MYVWSLNYIFSYLFHPASASSSLALLRERIRSLSRREAVWRRVLDLRFRLASKARWRRGAKIALLHKRSAKTIQVSCLCFHVMIIVHSRDIKRFFIFACTKTDPSNNKRHTCTSPQPTRVCVYVHKLGCLANESGMGQWCCVAFDASQHGCRDRMEDCYQARGGLL